MANPTNREEVLPNVVPAAFTPTPEQFKAPVSQELRNRQSNMTQGYALGRINDLEIQLHKSWYKRTATWQQMSEIESNAALEEAIKVAKTARTIMKEELSEWAGNLTEDEMTAALPSVWNEYVQRVQGPAEVAEEIEPAEAADEDALAPEDMELKPAVPDTPEISADAPKSEVVAPEEPSLGDILGMIAEDNSEE